MKAKQVDKIRFIMFIRSFTNAASVFLFVRFTSSCPRKKKETTKGRFNKTLKVKPIYLERRTKKKREEGEKVIGVYADALSKRDWNDTHMDLLNS